MEHIVTGCRDCPLNSNDRLYGDFCRHPSARLNDGEDNPLPVDANFYTTNPDWCPLKKQPITIKLEEHGD